MQTDENIIVISRTPSEELNYFFEYQAQETGYSLRIDELKLRGGSEMVGHTMKSGDFMDAALEKFSTALQNRRVIVDELEILFKRLYQNQQQFDATRTRLFSKLPNVLSQLKHKLSVRHLRIGAVKNANELEELLKMMKPATLKRLILGAFNSERTFDLSKIACTEHWKRLEEVYLAGFDLSLSVEQTLHMATATYNSPTLDLQTIKLMIEVTLFYAFRKNYFIIQTKILFNLNLKFQ